MHGCGVFPLATVVCGAARETEVEFPVNQFGSSFFKSINLYQHFGLVLEADRLVAWNVTMYNHVKGGWVLERESQS